MRPEQQPRFHEWLRAEIDKRRAVDRDYGIKTLARKLAEGHPEGANYRTIESFRSTLKKYLRPDGPRPKGRMRRSLAEALGVPESEIPTDPEEDALSALARDPDGRRALRMLANVFAKERSPLISSAPLGHENNPDEGVYD